nr:retrotransposon protein, putative, Ty1-copia subclass [Tanacetum cinerariifolium]
MPNWLCSGRQQDRRKDSEGRIRMLAEVRWASTRPQVTITSGFSPDERPTSAHAEKFNQEKERNEKLKEVKARLNFKERSETSRFSESRMMNSREHEIKYRSRRSSATRILNMVPTKKVDKTPYELWYGKVPNLSYLKVAGANNDIIVLDNSPSFDDLLDDIDHVALFVVNGVGFENGPVTFTKILLETACNILPERNIRSSASHYIHNGTTVEA